MQNWGPLETVTDSQVVEYPTHTLCVDNLCVDFSIHEDTVICGERERERERERENKSIE